MPFNASDLSSLSATNGFTLWHYRTNDDRATVLAPGYFAAAAPRLLPGDIVIVQAADATAFVPIRGGTLAGGGITVDAAGFAPSLLRSATLLVDVALTASATARSILLDPVAGLVLEGATVTVGATVAGPIPQVTFSLRNAAGADAALPQTVPVSAGRASATFTMPAAGSDFRFAAAASADPTLFVLSAPFVIAPRPRLLLEEGGRLLLENGGLVLL